MGKSFAYLVPALAWARANSERTVVSTNTINLQEQLVGKDLPLLRARARAPTTTSPPSRCSRAGGTISACPGSTGGRRPAHAAGAGQARRADRALAEWSSHTADGTLSDLPVDAEPGGVGRGERGVGPLPPAQVPPLRPLLPVSRPAPGGRGGRRGGESSPACRRPLGPAGPGQLGGRGRPAALPAPGAGRGAPPRGRRREPPRRAGDQPRACAGCSRASSGTAGAWRRRWLHELAGRTRPAEPRELRAPARAPVPGAGGRPPGQRRDARSCGCTSGSPRRPGAQLRLGDDFAVDPIWDEGLAFELDASLTAFRALREAVETIADRLDQADDTERRAPGRSGATRR